MSLKVIIIIVNTVVSEGIVNLYNEMNDLVNKSGMYLKLEDDNG